ncbi:uncharacterized protein [Clytia hemisphaerica]|uniref:Uncharacterized protein n=1 Tax=Clytia hemisphaerica TaxID=252671 RepID=A0A7M5XIS1_9CNID
METSMEYLAWKKSRTRTTALACILILVYGIESQSLEVTLLYYFSENFGLSLLQATFYYSVNETLFAISNLISGMLFGRYIDRTRNLRFVFLLNLGVICIGNLMYSIPWHIWLVLTGRFLCGINESLQTAVCGEFRRCYNHKELVKVLSWYEFFYSVGMNVGPGLPILFSYVNIHIGSWKINKYNAIQFLTAAITLVIFVISWFLVIDLSKDLEKLGEDAVAIARGRKQEDDPERVPLVETCVRKQEEDQDRVPLVDARVREQKEDPDWEPLVEEREREKDEDPEREPLVDRDDNSSSNTDGEASQERRLLGWRELFKLDILSLCLSYGVLRYSVTTAVAMVTLYSINTFHWQMNTLSWLHVIVGFSTYIFLMVLVYQKVFEGPLAIFYGYVMACSLAGCLLSLLVLPKLIVIPTMAGQIAFGVIIMATKCFVYFQAQSAGKVLLFNTVSDSNANLIDGFRSVFGNAFRILAKSTFYYFFLYPEYFSPPFIICSILFVCMLIHRRNLHLSH